jgi:phosphoglycolate phosphatase-like HAD superfamily hydrolase
MNAGVPVAIVFDIDGTLVDSDGFDINCFVEAVREVLGPVKIHEDWRLYRHATDAGILMQILEENGRAGDAAVVERVKEDFGRRVRRFLDGGGACPPLPGAGEALAALQADGYLVGIATGGWSHTARMKLERAGLPLDSYPLASSDISPDRAEIMAECLRRLGGDPKRAIYVGNGEWDRRAALRAGWAFIGVGPRLKGACDPWVADFTGPAWPSALRQAVLRLSR